MKTIIEKLEALKAKIDESDSVVFIADAAGQGYVDILVRMEDGVTPLEANNIVFKACKEVGISYGVARANSPITSFGGKEIRNDPWLKKSLREYCLGMEEE